MDWFRNITSKKMNKLKTELSDEQIYALEEHLAGTLKPVTPPMEVVNRLRERIHFPEPRMIVLHRSVAAEEAAA